MATQARTMHGEEEESYFISMTDVVIGLLFIFIIMLMFFAMRFQEASHQQQETTQRQNELIDDLTDAEQTRGSILDEIGGILQKEGINVVVVKDEGILRLPEELLFERASWDIRSTGPIRILAKALDQVLPCYTLGTRSRQADCPQTKAKIEAIFIEGHADPTPYRNPNALPPAPPVQPRRPLGTPQPNVLPAPAASTPSRSDVRRAPVVNQPPKDNLDLSALRATSTFRELLKTDQGLEQYQNLNGMPVLSVSGYGQYRPVAHEPNETNDRFLQRQRRIDLRILMSRPRSEEAKKMQRDLLGSETPQ